MSQFLFVHSCHHFIKYIFLFLSYLVKKVNTILRYITIALTDIQLKIHLVQIKKKKNAPNFFLLFVWIFCYGLNLVTFYISKKALWSGLRKIPRKYTEKKRNLTIPSCKVKLAIKVGEKCNFNWAVFGIFSWRNPKDFPFPSTYPRSTRGATDYFMTHRPSAYKLLIHLGISPIYPKINRIFLLNWSEMIKIWANRWC